MKRTIWMITLALVAGAGLVWAVEKVAGDPAESTSSAVRTEAAGQSLVLAVPTVTCGSCEGRIREALEAQSGVGAVEVDLGTRTVRVAYDPTRADPKSLAETVTRAGYPARYLPPGASLPVAPRSGGGCGGNCCGT